ncbi:MAG: inositol-3-phosphate synthase, partial [Myxococcota bacterium]
GSLTQMGRIEHDGEESLLADVLPTAKLDDVVFGGWDPFDADAFDSAVNAGVLSAKDLLPLEEEMRTIKPMKAVFDRDWVKNLEGTGNVKRERTKWDQAQALREDIQRFKDENRLDRTVMVWCASTEAYRAPTDVHRDLKAFEKGLKDDDANISPSQIYSYAALRERVPYANGAPNVSAEVPALLEMAQEYGVPVSGKDFKTGQTLMKTILAPGLKKRLLGLNGWFSTNILGNRDGEVLDDPESFKSKEVTKLGVLDSLLEPEKYPDLYGDMYHKVRINYYPPRGDDKEGWDSVDIFGWMGYPMQIKINFLCKDSILAAPIVLDLALLMDLAGRADQRGIQEWLGFYYKSPMFTGRQENDLFAQHDVLMDTLRNWIR